jgi:hypothetical protein
LLIFVEKNREKMKIKEGLYDEKKGFFIDKDQADPVYPFPDDDRYTYGPFDISI